MHLGKKAMKVTSLPGEASSRSGEEEKNKHNGGKKILSMKNRGRTLRKKKRTSRADWRGGSTKRRARMVSDYKASNHLERRGGKRGKR